MAGLNLGLGTGLPRINKRGPVNRIPGSSLHIDFTQNRIAGAPSIEAATTFTRSTVAKVDDTDLSLYDFPANTRRRLNGRGFRCEEVRTNLVRNSSGSSLVVGTPGSLPSGWAYFAPAGCNREVVGSYTLFGIKYTRVRLYGTPSSTSNIFIRFENNGDIQVTAGIHALSVYTRLAAGSMTNVSLSRLIVQEYTSGGSYVNSSMFGNLAMASAWQRQFDTLTMAGTAGNYARAFLQFGVTSGQAFDFTIDIAWPQLEPGSNPTSPIETTTTSVLRASDFMLLNTPAEFLGTTGGWVFVEWEELHGVTNIFRRLWRYRQDGNNSMELSINLDGRLAPGITIDGVAQLTAVGSTNPMTAGGIYKAALRWGVNDFAVRYSPSLGAQPANDTSVSLPAFSSTTFGIGNTGQDGSQPNNNFRQFACGTGPKTDAELLAMVA